MGPGRALGVAALLAVAVGTVACRRGEPEAQAPSDSAQQRGAPFVDSAQQRGAPFVDSAQQRGAPFIDSAQQRGAPAGFQRGVSLGLFSEDVLFSYEGLLKEIAALGADHVELVVAYYQRDGQSTDIVEHPRFTAPAATVLRTIREAHALGLKVLLFPILRLSDPAPGEWRGTLRPRDRDAWWRSYAAVMDRVAALATAGGAEGLSIGSELSTLDGAEDRPHWEALRAAVRRRFQGHLTYSGNWDHYQKVGLYDLVDSMGVCGYFSLARRGGATPQPALTQAWRELRPELLARARAVGRPLLFTEVGYLSQRGAAAWPWEEGAAEPVDLEDQRRAYAAFVDTWAGDAELSGVYFWNWYGFGGSASAGYTPRDKPAEAEIRRFFQRP